MTSKALIGLVASLAISASACKQNATSADLTNDTNATLAAPAGFEFRESKDKFLRSRMTEATGSIGDPSNWLVASFRCQTSENGTQDILLEVWPLTDGKPAYVTSMLVRPADDIIPITYAKRIGEPFTVLPHLIRTAQKSGTMPFRYTVSNFFNESAPGIDHDAAIDMTDPAIKKVLSDCQGPLDRG